MALSGSLAKLRSDLADPVCYRLPVGDCELPLDPMAGRQLTIRHTGAILCTHCGRATKKSYSQGHCFPCSQRLAACDLCIVKPERCHYHEGTCREPEWGEAHCMQPHVVYIANTSGLKVGITRKGQIPTRWIDQGAREALPVVEVASRRIAGLLEVALAEHIADRTDWRAMLRGDPPAADLKASANRLLDCVSESLERIGRAFGPDSFSLLRGADLVSVRYPVREYPAKIRSLNLDKQPEITGTLLGIKGQYLMFDSGVLNVRKYTGYMVCVEH
jgi:hypothetical protein